MLKKSFILIIAIIAVSVPGCSRRGTPSGEVTSGKAADKITNEGDFQITIVDNKTVTITGYQGESTDVIIPPTIGGLPVTKIEENAFR